MATNGRHPTGVPTALLYIRVSSDDQAREGLSLPAQLADTRRYATQHGALIGGEYQDVLTGKRPDRPGYQDLLTRVRTLRAEDQTVIVVVKWLDRFGREVLERARVAKELRDLSVPIHSVMEGPDVSPFMQDMLAAVAAEEIRRLGERVSAVRQHTAQQGWAFPGRTSWGYRWRPATAEERGQGAPKSVLELDPDTAPYAREAFERVAAGETIHSVARWAQSLPEAARGWPVSAETAARKRATHSRAPWPPKDDRIARRLAFAPVREMLRAPVYVARLTTGAEDVLARPIGRWPALVDDETWAKVQARISGHKRLPHQGRYLLTGFLRCPRCGARMVGKMPKDRPLRYYCTGSLALGTAAPDPTCNVQVMARTLEPAVVGLVGDVLALAVDRNPEHRRALARAWARLSRPTDDSTRRQIADLERIASDGKARLAKAAGMLVDGTLDKLGYEAMRDQVLADVESANAEVARLRGQEESAELPDLDAVLADVESWRDLLSQADVANQRDVLASLVDSMVPVRLGHGRYTAEVRWSQLGRALQALAENGTS